MIKLWFKAKEYGWGWYPATWQGWLTMLIWIVLVVTEFLHLDMESYLMSDVLINFIPRFIVLTLLLLIVCFKKGEKPGWRWGK